MSIKRLLKNALKPFIDYVEFQRLPDMAKAAARRDRSGLDAVDPGIEAVTQANIGWLCRAQDCSTSQDGGVARHYSLVRGWSESYPETTGYIVPTFIDWHRRSGESDILNRARRMLNWFVEIQFPEGGFQGGMISGTPKVPVTFNTGQILLGLVAGVAQFGDEYAEAMHKAARWLRDSQDEDGAWRRHPTPFAIPGEKVYETHVAWGLLEAARVAPDQGYAEAALKNIRWALSKQAPNGWFSSCCLSHPEKPLTHTIGYVLRGVLEGWRYSQDERLLAAARNTADALVTLIDADGRLPGSLDSAWRPAANWVCLTGSSQNAQCLLMLYQDTGEQQYLTAARALNRFVRRSISLGDDPNIHGGVKGSFPVNGDYGRYEYLNWAAKFTIDANLLEQDVVSES